MSEGFPPADRRLFQILIDNQLEPVEYLANLTGETNLSMFYHQINTFCSKYQCSSQIQVLNWELIGLQSFFILTRKPVQHPYIIREFELLAEYPRYLVQFVAPNVNPHLDLPKDFFPITQIYRPSNNIGLLYTDERSIGFVDEWLLNLKEDMVDQEIGDIIYTPDIVPLEPLNINTDFLDNLGSLYIRGNAGRFDTRLTRQIQFIKENYGFLSTYYNIKIPDMVDYLLILDKVENPKLFIGGFLGKFPLLEIYESTNAIICRFQIPEPHFSKFSLVLFMHLQEICLPYLWLLTTDSRKYELHNQWVQNKWLPFNDNDLINLVTD